ncbi:efflux RND transporter permease subunit [Brevundimonas sp. VNH65]|uniref:efflux RND transporter permease subunit n=1 Tax=Brevundimonas sp. VNH65 TaxID=3400917 RepID=UPI003C00FAC0
MLSDVSVRRPVFAAVAAIVLCVIGLAAFFFLPVRELPDVDPPVVSVNTSYAGASAEVIESRITEPIEQQIAGIQGVERINSTSRDGRSNVNIEFSLDRNIDDAANDVRDRVSRVVGRLPDQADPPEVAKADSDSSPIIILFLRSTDMTRLELTDYADRYLVDRLATVPGVATVNIFGEQRYAMRIWLDPAALAARGLTVTDVETSLTSQNVELPAGTLESGQKDYTVRVARTYSRPEDFRQLPIGVRGATSTSVATQTTGGATAAALPSGASGAIQGRTGYVTRLGDVARVEEAPAEDRRLFRGNGLDQIGLAVTRQAQSNDLAISDGVKKLMEEVRPTLPPGVTLEVGTDNSVFTSHAIDEVWITIGISMALVALVNFIFLGSLRAALIPSVVAPICLLATFIVLAPLGFSLNLLTLLALVLAIGLVVDDAIVVVENIQRRLDHGEPPLVAAERGARQVFFAVVATTIVLLSVFAPLLFLPGYVGRLFVELAAAIAAAVAFSAFLALSLSPMMASKILRPAKTGGWLNRRVDGAMDRLRESYGATLSAFLGKRVALFAVIGLFVVVVGGAAAMFVSLPNELVPQEDRGRVTVRVAGPEGAGFDYTREIMLGIEPLLQEYRDNGEASNFLVSAPGFGGGSFNSGNAVLNLADWSERDRSSDEIAQELNGKLRTQTGAQVNASVPGAFQRGGGGGGGNSVEMIVTGAEYADIYNWLQPVLAASLENPGFSRPRLNYEPNSPRLLVDVDPEKAAGLGVSAQSIGRTLETMFGSRRATTYIRGGQEYDVILQTNRDERRNVADLEALYVTTGSGQLVPLSAVVRTQTSGDTPDRRRLDRQRSISLQADLNPGYTINDAVTFLTDVAADQPQGVVSLRWGGAARDQAEAGGAVIAAFGLALLLVFLVLAAQFESWITPAVIMLTVPLAAAGGLFGLTMAGSSLNLYSQIGLIILIGVAAKNGILIVEFANQLRDQGRSIIEAIIESSTLRLRPIIMTSIATAFGALPLVLWQGAGAGSRQTIGVVIFAGAIFATLLTLFVVPVIYALLARFTKSPEYTARLIEEWEAREVRADADDKGPGHGPAPMPAPAE